MVKIKDMFTTKSKYKLFLVISLLAIISLVTGTSYAILKGTVTSDKEHIIKAGNITLELTEYYDDISDNILIYSDKQGLLQEKAYEFNIKNIGTATAKFDIKLINEGTGDKILADEYIRVGLEVNGKEYGPMGLADVENVIDSGIINVKEIISYKMRLWLDESKKDELSELSGYSVSFKLKVEAEQRVIKNLDTSGANVPKLSKNMIPVYYDEKDDVWRKADKENTLEDYQWYNYDEKMWANSVTVIDSRTASGTCSNSEYTNELDCISNGYCPGDSSITDPAGCDSLDQGDATDGWQSYEWTEGNTVTGIREKYLKAPLGTEIDMDDILTMQVWIPRYKYKVWNYNLDGTVGSDPQEIEITFEGGTETTGEIKCTDYVQGTSDGTSSGTAPTTSEICKLNNAECTDSTCNGKTYTHPAFTFGKDELTGIWVGKFELSSDISCTVTDRSAVGADCNLTTIRPLIKPNVTNWCGAMVGTFENNMMAMNDSGNKYGFALADDTHMIKNSEWGAITYLSHSKYGINKEVALNSVSTYITGCGPQEEGSVSSGSACNAYNTTLGQSASTTGNIYGVYDMSGGAYEYVMGNVVSPNGTAMMTGYRSNTSYPNDHSGYSGILYFNDTTVAGYGTYTGYYGNYPEYKYYDKYSFNTSSSTIGRSKLGEATKEVFNTSSYGWYSDNSILAYNSKAWVNRGGFYSDGSNAGAFNSRSYNGESSRGRTSRLVISQ